MIGDGGRSGEIGVSLGQETWISDSGGTGHATHPRLSCPFTIKETRHYRQLLAT